MTRDHEFKELLRVARDEDPCTRELFDAFQARREQLQASDRPLEDDPYLV